jgi:hypothetical protein
LYAAPIVVDYFKNNPIDNLIVGRPDTGVPSVQGHMQNASVLALPFAINAASGQMNLK